MLLLLRLPLASTVAISVSDVSTTHRSIATDI
jgi:hypothetical protein